MKLSENAQELLERLWVATEEEARTGLTINGREPEGVDELVRQGSAERKGEQLRLTPAGRPEAAQAVRRHRLAERLLADVLTTEETLLEEQACRLDLHPAGPSFLLSPRQADPRGRMLPSDA
jgi:DtxR family Mn-dependent transcriptional regulator